MGEGCAAAGRKGELWATVALLGGGDRLLGGRVVVDCWRESGGGMLGGRERGGPLSMLLGVDWEVADLSTTPTGFSWYSSLQ